MEYEDHINSDESGESQNMQKKKEIGYETHTILSNYVSDCRSSQR